MRYLIILSLILVGCKESGSLASKTISPSCVTVDPLATDINETPTSDLVMASGNIAVGYCIAFQGDYAWVQDAVDTEYHYAINMDDGSLLEVPALIFSDAGCTVAVGEHYTYPLHLTGDVFVFSFEGNLYEYEMTLMPWVAGGSYFEKASGGACVPQIFPNNTIRKILPSSFSRTFSGPLEI